MGYTIGQGLKNDRLSASSIMEFNVGSAGSIHFSVLPLSTPVQTASFLQHRWFEQQQVDGKQHTWFDTHMHTHTHNYASWRSANTLHMDSVQCTRELRSVFFSSVHWLQANAFHTWSLTWAVRNVLGALLNVLLQYERDNPVFPLRKCVLQSAVGEKKRWDEKWLFPTVLNS